MNTPPFIEPSSDGWRRLITPSKVAAILGVSRFESPYRLWHRMRGTVPAEPPKDIFDVGHDMEPALANMWRRRNPGWLLSRSEVQLAHRGLPFPNVATVDRRARKGRARRVVEFKTTRHLSDWGDEFTDQAPADYVAQVQAQQLITGWTRWPAHLCVLGPFYTFHIYEIEFDATLGELIVERCYRFWQSLQAGEPPGLDDSVATYECVRQLHPGINDSTVKVSDEFAFELRHARARLDELERQFRSYKTTLLDAMGEAATAITADGEPVARRTPHGKSGVALRIAKQATGKGEEE